MAGTDRLIARRPLTVGAVAAELEVPAQVAAGAEFAVAWTGPNNRGDFITLVTPDSARRRLRLLPLHGERKPRNDARARCAWGATSCATHRPELPHHRAHADRGRRRERLGQRPRRRRRAGSAVRGEVDGARQSRSTTSRFATKGARQASTSTWASSRRAIPSTVHAPLVAGDYELRYSTGQSHLTLATARAARRARRAEARRLEGDGRGATLAGGRGVEVILDASGSMLQKTRGADAHGRRARDADEARARDDSRRSAVRAARVRQGSGLMPLRSRDARSRRSIQPRSAQTHRRARGEEQREDARSARRSTRVQDLNPARRANGLIVLITDGEETCGGDPAAAIEKLAGRRVR